MPDAFEILQAIEADLGEPRFRGIPIGPCLADLINIEVVGAPGVLTCAAWKNPRDGSSIGCARSTVAPRAVGRAARQDPCDPLGQ